MGATIERIARVGRGHSQNKNAGLIHSGRRSVTPHGPPQRRQLVLLVDVPEHRNGRALGDAGQRGPPDARHLVFAERDVDHLVIGFLLDLGGELLLLLRRGRARILVAQLLQLGVFAPAEPAAIALAAAGRSRRWLIGLRTSAPTQLVKNMLQPPSLMGFWLARRVTTVCQSVACTSTLKPALRSNCAATIGCAFNVVTSVGAMITTGVPS